MRLEKELAELNNDIMLECARIWVVSLGVSVSSKLYSLERHILFIWSYYYQIAEIVSDGPSVD